MIADVVLITSKNRIISGSSLKVYKKIQDLFAAFRAIEDKNAAQQKLIDDMLSVDKVQ